MDEEVIKEVNTFSGALDASKTGIWNGAIGVFEFEKFAAGTDVSIISHNIQLSICNYFVFAKLSFC
jgi:3-phosphoglycerate kinase